MIIAMDAITGFRAQGLTAVVANAAVKLFTIVGPDAQRFLQNRTTNDVMALTPGQGHWNAVLNKKAQIEGVFFLALDAVQPDTYWLMVESAMADSMQAALLQFKLLEQFEMTPVEGLQCVVCAGANLAETLAPITSLPTSLVLLPSASVAQLPFSGARPGLALKLHLSGEPELWLWVPSSQAPQLTESLLAQPNVVSLPSTAYSVLALEGGYPQVGEDYALGTLMPETGWEQWAASYSKGCYLGQETIARVKTYGAVQQAQVVLALEGQPDFKDAEFPPTAIRLAASSEGIGHARRLFYSPALKQWAISATLGKDYRVPGSTHVVTFATPEGDVLGPCQVTVHLLPMVSGQQLQQKALELRQQGLAAFANNQPEEALRLLRQSLALDARHPDALEALGAVLGRQGHYEEAAALMQQLTTLEPDRVMGWTNLSVYYMHLGDKEKAEEAKAQATVVAMRQKMAASGLKPSAEAEAAAQAARTQQLEERVALFAEALVHSPDDPLGNFGLGSTLLELSRFAEAVEALSKTVGRPTSQSAAYVKLGQAYEGTGQLDKALQVYREGIQVASRRRDLQPLKELEARLAHLEALSSSGAFPASV